MAKDQAYREAEERIEIARLMKRRKLSPRYLGLAELPKAISQLTGLQSLDIFNNRLAALPEIIGQVNYHRQRRWLVDHAPSRCALTDALPHIKYFFADWQFLFLYLPFLLHCFLDHGFQPEDRII